MFSLKNILILGYYFNKIFFYKKDFNILNLNINKINFILLKFKNNFIYIFSKIIILLKRKII
jgi:hypothetical protein